MNETLVSITFGAIGGVIGGIIMLFILNKVEPPNAKKRD